MALLGEKRRIYLGLHLEEGRKSHAFREISLSSCFQRLLSVSPAISFTLIFFFYQNCCWNCIIQGEREECDIYWWRVWMEEKELTVTDSEDLGWQKCSKLWLKSNWSLKGKPLSWSVMNDSNLDHCIYDGEHISHCERLCFQSPKNNHTVNVQRISEITLLASVYWSKNV